MHDLCATSMHVGIVGKHVQACGANSMLAYVCICEHIGAHPTMWPTLTTTCDGGG
jgi:hypothetical protein